MATSSVLATLFLLTASAPNASPIEFVLKAPAVVELGEPFKLEFAVRNTGHTGVYFKQPWKWAINAMYVLATSTEGLAFDSPVALWDLSADEVCKYFWPLGPGEEIRFSQELTWLLPVGEYDLRWIYDPVHYERDNRCLTKALPLWRERSTSQAVRVQVREQR